MRHTLLISILIVLLTFEIQAQKLEFEKVSAKKFQALILEDEDYLLIDVDSKSVFDQSRIEGSISAETSQILYSILDTTPENLPVLIYCTSGDRSLKACQLVNEMYPHKIYDLKGGLNNWEDSGFKISHKFNSSK